MEAKKKKKIKAKRRFGCKQEEKMKAESERELLFFFFFESEIRACGGGRCGRADMIQSGRCDVRRGTRRNEPLMIPSGIQSRRQQRRRRREETRKVKLRGLRGQRCGGRRHLICFPLAFLQPTHSPVDRKSVTPPPLSTAADAKERHHLLSTWKNTLH